MDIIKVVNFAFVMCLINGYVCSSLSSNETLVITEHDCTENYTTIINNTRVQYEPVTYNYVLENEDIILELLSEGQEVMLSEYGEIRKIPMPLGSCYNLSDSKSLREQIQSSSEQPPRPSQDCINRKYWETVAVTAPTCGCFHIHIAILGVVARRVVRRRFHQDASTPHGDHGDDLDNNTATELNSIGSSDDVSAMGPVLVAGSVPGSHDGSGMGTVPFAGSVSGRTDQTTAAQSTTCDAVPGRTSRGYNFHYAQS